MLLVIAAWIFIVVLVVLIWAVISNFMIPIMYRRRCRAYEAFRSAASLIATHPGEIVLYCLFLMGLGLVSLIVACFVTCVTCCIAAIPYIGTVILLPLFILFRSFSLLFLRQFGPNYDVWASFIPLESSPLLLSSAPPVPPPSSHQSNPPAQPPLPP
jgi:hypothetical protein